VILYAYRVLVLCIKYLWRTLKRNKGGNKGNRGGILGGNPDRSLKSFPPCYSQTPLLTNCTPSSFSFLGLEISTALPCDFYSNSWGGGGDVWVNKYLDHWRVSNYQANKLFNGSHEIWTQIISFEFQCFHHWTIEDIYVTSKITCINTILQAT
jgi:hypothetical protein